MNELINKWWSAAGPHAMVRSRGVGSELPPFTAFAAQLQRFQPIYQGGSRDYATIFSRYLRFCWSGAIGLDNFLYTKYHTSLITFL
jgi:hypothetical protein